MKLNLIKHVVAELAEQIGGSRVSKIHQPAPEVLLFKLWNGKDTLRLLLSAEAHKCRLHLTDRTWPNPHIPPRFCQLLRARISRISTVSVINDDRIVQFECIGKHGDCCLLLEMIGNRSNLILVDERGTIIDVLKRILGTENHRAMMPGEKYIYPQKQNSTIACDQQLLLNDVSENSWNGYVEKLYSGDEHAENKGAFCRQLQQTISRQIKKLQKRLLGIEKDLQ
ncbi:MAG: NFACT family protein, partial [Desulfuromonadales bacterium]|nr:NFACT family protein [Desulfuromonadales bacterium]